MVSGGEYDNPVTDRTFTDIPVTVVNDDIVTASNRTYQILDGTQQVNVTVTATRQELSRITADDIHAVADMRGTDPWHSGAIQVTIEGHSYEEAYSTPRNLQVKIEEEARNNFPITPTTIGTVREGYVIGNLRADPEGVTIRRTKERAQQHQQSLRGSRRIRTVRKCRAGSKPDLIRCK